MDEYCAEQIFGCPQTPRKKSEIRSLKAEATSMPGVGDGEQREEVAADAQEDVERVEDHGDADESGLVLDARVAILGRVVAHAEVAGWQFNRIKNSPKKWPPKNCPTAKLKNEEDINYSKRYSVSIKKGPKMAHKLPKKLL